MSTREILPDIPLLPEEREAALKNKKPKLPGAPNEAYESLLLSIEESLPMLQDVGRDLKSYGEIAQSDKKKEFRYQKFHYFLDHPEGLEDYLDTIRILGDVWEGRQAEVRAFGDDVFGNLEKFIDVGTLTPEAWGGWLSILARSELYRPIAERVIKGVMDKLKTPEAVVGFVYNLAQALITSKDALVIKSGLEVATGSADFLGDQSRFVFDYSKAMFAINNDKLLRNVTEAEAVLNHLGNRYSPETLRAFKIRRSEIPKMPEYKEYVHQLADFSPEKIRAIIDYYDKSGRSSFISLSKDEIKKWPLSVFIHSGRLRELLNAQMEAETDQYVSLYLPKTGLGLCVKDGICQTVLSALRESPQGTVELKDELYVKALFFISPEISMEIRVDLAVDVAQLREYVNKNNIYSISPRGDRVFITDPDVKKLDIKTITFKVEEHAPNITVWVEVANYKYVLILDTNLNLRLTTGKELPVSVEQRAYMEDLILSHLKELICTERMRMGEKESNGNGNGAHSIEREREFKGARAHLMKLPPGKGFTPKALAQGLADPRHYDLPRINAERGFTKETGEVTYVKAHEEPIPGQEPISSRAPHATDRLKEILQKKQNGIEQRN